MEWCRTRRKGGVSKYLAIQVYDALETLRFGCVFVCKLPIDRRGPITEGIGISPFQNRGKPAVSIDPVHCFAGDKIEDMRTTAEAVDSRPGTTVCVLKAP